jgi:hypothetical protein
MSREEVKKRKTPFEYRTLAHLPAAHIAGVQGYMINPVWMGGPVYVRNSPGVDLGSWQILRFPMLNNPWTFENLRFLTARLLTWKIL